MRRLATVSTVMVVAAIAALFLSSVVWSVEEKPGSILAAVRSVRRPQVKTVGPARITGQLKKGLSKADLNKLKAPPEDSRRIRIPKARVHTVKESTSVVRKLKGGPAFLKSVPVPTSGELPDNASLLLTPLKPRGTLAGVKSASISLSGVCMTYGDNSLERCASQDSVCIGSEGNGGSIHVIVAGMEPGWYIVAGDFMARSPGFHGLRGIWTLVDDGEATTGESESSSTLKRGDELFLPVMFQVTHSNSSAGLLFYSNCRLPIWFRSISVQKLN